MLFNPDFKDMLRALSDAKIDFLLVGAYAVAAHGHPRATGDLDLCLGSSGRRKRARRFGAPLHDLTIDDLSRPGMVFQIGVEHPELTSSRRSPESSSIMHGQIECRLKWTACNSE